MVFIAFWATVIFDIILPLIGMFWILFFIGYIIWKIIKLICKIIAFILSPITNSKPFKQCTMGITREGEFDPREQLEKNLVKYNGRFGI